MCWARLAGPLGLHTGLLGESRRQTNPPYSFLPTLLPLGRPAAFKTGRTGSCAGLHWNRGQRAREGQLGQWPIYPYLEILTCRTSSLPSCMTCLCIRGGPTSGGLVCLVRPALPPLSCGAVALPCPGSTRLPGLASLHPPHPGISYVAPNRHLTLLGTDKKKTLSLALPCLIFKA